MGKFKRTERREVPPLNTASLPDLIFTLLFFFMITTSMKEMPLMVDIDPPTATELTKLEKKSLITYLYIGKPSGSYAQKLGDENRIQLNDKFIDESDIEREMIRERAAMKEENQGYMQVSIKADRGTEMGIITATKEALKRSNNLNIVMKFLSIITIVMSIPTIVFSAYGMNVNASGMPFAGSSWGFLIVILFSIVLSCIAAIFLSKKRLF